MEKSKKKKNVFVVMLRYVIFLAIIFVASIWLTKYLTYDSDWAVKQTDLTPVLIDGIKLGMNINDIDISKYTSKEEVVDKCNHNFEELSIKTDSKGIIEYITADYSKIKLEIGQEEYERIEKASGILKVLGSNYKEETYKPEINNFWKIARYTDAASQTHFGMVYSRYNGDIDRVILSSDKIKN